MKFEKVSVAQLERCYATGSTVVDGETRYLLATEGQGACVQVAGPDFRTSTVWHGPGGTMCFVRVPEANGDFLAVQNFFPTFDSKHAVISWCTPQADDHWDVKVVLNLPYVHRFDVLSADGVHYFVGCTLCTSKKDKDDWSDPGKVWVGELPKTPHEAISISPILDGLVRNHGYCHVTWKGRDAGLVTADQGVFVILPPAKKGGEWTIEKLLDRPVSDVTLCDIDGDGVDEMLTLEPFHGKTVAVSKLVNGKYEVMWTYEKPVDFAHVAWGGTLRGKPCFLFAYRKEGAELVMVTCEKAEPFTLKYEVIEAGGGPSNVSVVHEKDRDVIVTANRMTGEAALFLVTE